VIGFLSHFLHAFDSHSNPEKPTQIQLVIGGYSYGSMIASHTASPTDILQQFAAAKEGTAGMEIRLRATHLAAQLCHELQAEAQTTPTKRRPSQRLQVGGEETSPEKRRRSGEHRRLSSDLKRSLDLVRRLPHIVRRSHETPPAAAATPQHDDNSSAPQPDQPIVEPAYLLISPLLPPSSLIAFSLSHSQQQREEMTAKLNKYLSLAVYGSNDFFTAARRLRPWAKSIAEKPDSRFTYVEIEGAGHFWHEQGVEKRLRMAVREWVRGLQR
jgi:alpha/beta superfamily hydrolase